MKHCHNHKCTVIHQQDDCPICEEQKLANEIVENLCNKVDSLTLKITGLEYEKEILDAALTKAVARPRITVLSE